jgi:hypothetical protein
VKNIELNELFQRALVLIEDGKNGIFRKDISWSRSF